VENVRDVKAVRVVTYSSNLRCDYHARKEIRIPQHNFFKERISSAAIGSKREGEAERTFEKMTSGIGLLSFSKFERSFERYFKRPLKPRFLLILFLKKYINIFEENRFPSQRK